jgi:hypothetical protein
MKRNNLAWIGPAVTFAGVVTYFMWFTRFPLLRDFPWLNLPLVLVGVVLSFLGVKAVFSAKRPWSRKLAAAGGLVLSAALATLFVGYVFVLSSMLPEARQETMAMAAAPSAALTDAGGAIVDLSDYRGRKAVLVFYRGYW